MILNEKNESKKVVLGLVIGGVVGATALYFLNASCHHKTPVLHKIGRAISEVGAMLENTNVGSGSDIIHDLEKKLPKGTEVMNNVASWIASGMDLWKQLKKGW